MEDRFIIYVVTNVATGKQYVGATKHSLEKRWAAHIHAAFNRRPGKRWNGMSADILAAGMALFSGAFRVECAYEAVNELEACMVERGMIAERGCLSPNGYNSHTGGEWRVGSMRCQTLRQAITARLTGKPKTAEHRAKLSAANLGQKMTQEQKANHLAAAQKRRGIPMPAEVRAKISAKNMGHPVSAEARAKMSAARKAAHAAKMAANPVPLAAE